MTDDLASIPIGECLTSQTGALTEGRDDEDFQRSCRRKITIGGVFRPAASIPVGEGNGSHADLDLRLIDPNGFIAASASSYDSGYEIFEYVVPSSGGGNGYSLEVRHWSWDYCPELSFFGYPYVKAAVAYDIR